MVTRWSRSTSNFRTLIGQNLTGEFMLKTVASGTDQFPTRSADYCVFKKGASPHREALRDKT